MIDFPAVFAALRSFRPNWDVTVGVPNEAGWMPGDAFTKPDEGPFADLLARIGTRLGTDDRKVIAGAFALRFGWASGAALGPYYLHQAVPDVRLDNVSLRFGEHTLFERVAIHHPCGTALELGMDVRVAPSTEALHASLQTVLLEQAAPMVEALSRWAERARRATWGLVTSSWAAQLTAILGELGRHEEASSEAQRLFDHPNMPRAIAPKLYPVCHADTTRVYQRRASCCLYYKTPSNTYCATCPLLREEERLARNRAWLETSLQRSP